MIDMKIYFLENLRKIWAKWRIKKIQEIPAICVKHLKDRKEKIQNIVADEDTFTENVCVRKSQ